jgi:hypothetical protein
MAPPSCRGGFASRRRRSVACTSKGNGRLRGDDRESGPSPLGGDDRESGPGPLGCTALDARGHAQTAACRCHREPSRTPEYGSHSESRALELLAGPHSASARKRRSRRPRRPRGWRQSRAWRVASGARRRVARRRWIARGASRDPGFGDLGRRHFGGARSTHRSGRMAGRQVRGISDNRGLRPNPKLAPARFLVRSILRNRRTRSKAVRALGRGSDRPAIASTFGESIPRGRR